MWSVKGAQLYLEDLLGLEVEGGPDQTRLNLLPRLVLLHTSTLTYVHHRGGLRRAELVAFLEFRTTGKDTVKVLRTLIYYCSDLCSQSQSFPPSAPAGGESVQVGLPGLPVGAEGAHRAEGGGAAAGLCGVVREGAAGGRAGGVQAAAVLQAVPPLLHRLRPSPGGKSADDVSFESSPKFNI